jgi:hypothetical protein
MGHDMQKIVITTDFGETVIDRAMLKAYGLLHEPASKDKRRKEVKRYFRQLRLLEKNIAAIAQHNWILGK